MLDIRQLEAFVAFMAGGSVTHAARMLGRSQSGVTRQIQDLELSIGFDLLLRNGRRVAPTERAALFHIEAERHLAGLRHLVGRAENLRLGGGEALDIAVVPAFAGWLSQAIAHLDGAESIPTHLQAVGGEEVVRLVLARTTDLGLCSLPLRSDGLVLHLVAELPCIVLLREDDKLAAEPVVPLQALANRRLITTANPYRLERHVDEALQKIGLSRQVPLDTNTSFGAMAAVRAGLGVALIEPLTPLGTPIQGLVVRPIDAHIPFRYGAVTAVGRPLTPLIQSVIEALRTVMVQQLPDLRLISIDEAAAEMAA